MKRNYKYTRNLNRLEFLITLACTGRCKHCSEGSHTASGKHIDGDAAADAVRKICGAFSITSLMTFGGEPLLYAGEVCKIHSAAREMEISKRQLITNGYFSRDEKVIRETAEKLAQSGVTDLLLSVDAFHQETIPLEPVKIFAGAVRETGIPIRTQPAWLVDSNDPNPYNQRTYEILREFDLMGIASAKGNIIYPEGNARRYLSEYFDSNKDYMNPYAEDSLDIRSICVAPDGDVLGGNIYERDILDILDGYVPPT